MKVSFDLCWAKMNPSSASPQLFHPSLLVQDAFSVSSSSFFPMFHKLQRTLLYLACAMFSGEFRSWYFAVEL